MKKQKKQTKIHIDNLYLMKKLDTAYLDEFNRFYDYIIHSKNDAYKINIMVNIALAQCLDGMKKAKKPTTIIPKDLKEYVNKISKGKEYRDMKKHIRNQDYEKLHISSIWYTFMLCIVLFFFKNLLIGNYTLNYVIDAIVGCAAGGFALKNFLIRRRIINRYQFGSFYIRLDIVTLVVCIFIKLITPKELANFDITYLLLVISFFVMKKKIKPQFENAV